MLSIRLPNKPWNFIVRDVKGLRWINKSCLRCNHLSSCELSVQGRFCIWWINIVCNSFVSCLFYVASQFAQVALCYHTMISINYMSIALEKRPKKKNIYMSLSAQETSHGYNVTYSNENSLKVNVIFKVMYKIQISNTLFWYAMTQYFNFSNIDVSAMCLWGIC